MGSHNLTFQIRENNELVPYVSAMVLSGVFEALLYLVSILNLMQFSAQPSLEIMPCLMAFLFCDLVFHMTL